MVNRVVYCILFVLGGCFCSTAQSVQQSLYFDNYSVTNGLTSNTITSICRDSRGFLWIGTPKGLNKFDGREVKTYIHNRNNPHSISNNYIQSIAEDSTGNIWLGTKIGVCKFNSFNETADNFYHDPADSLSLKNDKDNYVYIDSYNTVWIGNSAGLSRYNASENNFSTVSLSPDSASGQKSIYHLGRLLEDSHRRFWVTTYTGLLLYDRGNHTAQRIPIEGLAPDMEPPVTSVFEDHAGRIWSGTWDSGFCLYNPRTNKRIAFKWNHNDALPGTTNIVLSISESRKSDGSYILWVGAAEGLMRIKLPEYPNDPDFKKLSESIELSLKNPPFVTNSASVSQTLESSSVHALYYDNEHILWVGSDQGLFEYLEQNQLFKLLPVFKGTCQNILADTIGGSRKFLIATWYGDGLITIDDSLHWKTNSPTIPPKAKNKDNGQISDVFRTSDELLWIATFHGLYSYDQKTGLYKSWLHDPKNPNTPATNRIIALGEDDQHNLWISNYHHGLDRMDLNTKRFTHFEHQESNSESLCDNLVWNIRKLPFGKMAFCTNNGLSIFDTTSGVFENYIEKRGNNLTLQGQMVNDVLTDKSGDLWIATDEGLNRLNPKTGEFKLYARQEGLKNEEIRGMAFDKNERIWLVSENSIAVFDPSDETIINYDENNGLPAVELGGSIVSDGHNGFLAGGKDVLVHFKPGDFNSHISGLPVHITRVEINGVQKISDKSFEALKQVEMDYPEHSFSCAFTAPVFHNGNQVRYSYRLDGIDKKWENSGNRNFVEYANLSPGSYLFHIRATNGEGIWNQNDTSLLFIVHPPFWETWWFRIAALLLLILIVYLIFRFRVSAIRRTEKLKTEANKQMAEMRLKVLRNRMNPHFMFNALNSIQECIYTGKTDSAYRYLSKFSKLVRMILERSDDSFITLGEEIEILDLYLQLESLRFEQHFNYKITTNNLETDFLKMPPMLVQPFVENAIWHGLLHKEGEKILLIDFTADDTFITVTIQDNGVGRDAARTNKINIIHNQQSLGMQIISEQLNSEHLKTVANSESKAIGFKVEDLYAESAETSAPKVPSGTRVTLILPIIT